MLPHTFNASLNRRLSALDITDETRRSLDEQRTKLAGRRFQRAKTPTRSALKSAVAGSFVAGFRAVMSMAVGLSLPDALSAWLLIEGKGFSAPERRTGRAGVEDDSREKAVACGAHERMLMLVRRDDMTSQILIRYSLTAATLSGQQIVFG